MKTLKFVCASLLLATLAGCAFQAPVIPPTGLIFTSTSAPIDIDMQATPMSSRYGESGSIAVLGLFAFGDASVTTAARNGNLQTVEYAEYDYLNILFVFQSFKMRVYGQ